MRENTLLIINFSKIVRHTETDYEDKEPSRCQEDRSKTHHPSSKPRKDFGGKPAVRKIQVTTPESSDSSESSDDQNPQTDEGGEEETYEACVLKAGLSFEKNTVTASNVEKWDTSPGNAPKIRMVLQKRI